MTKISLRNRLLFESLLEIQADKNHFDLHNDFECVDIRAEEDLSFRFENEIHQIDLVFEKYQLVNQKIDFEKLNLKTLDNFHRGRYENGQLWDEYKGKVCFYLEFVESLQTLTILAENIFFKFRKFKPIRSSKTL